MNQIDDLFSKKLKNMEVAPSDIANALFAEKLANRKKGGRKLPIVLWFSMAASLVLVACVGLYFFKNKEKNVEALAQNTSVKDQNTNLKAQNSIEIATKRSQEFLNVQTQVQVEAKNSQPKPSNVSSKATDGFVAVQPEIQKVAPTIVEKTEVKIIENKAITSELAQVENKQKPIFDAETIVLLTPLMGYGSYPKMGENRKSLNIQTNVGEKEDYFSEDKSLFVRVIDEVKNLKKGEKVDFNKLGFKPIEELAMNQDGFIVSETNQIKDKINWIKARLNNN